MLREAGHNVYTGNTKRDSIPVRVPPSPDIPDSHKECAMQKKYRVMGFVILLLTCMMGCTAAMKADMRMNQNDYGAAIELYTEHLAQNPGDLRARSRLGLAYLKAGMTDKAASEFESVFGSEPADPFSTLYLGITYLRQKRLDEAITTWEKFRDSERPLVEEEVERQLALLRAVRDKETPFGKADQFSATDDSLIAAAKQRTLQMDESIKKVEAAWEEAEQAALTPGEGQGDGDGGGGGG